MEGRVSSDQDLKLGDTLRYYQRDSNAAKALLVRRLRCLAAYEAANRNLEKARAKNKDVHAVRMHFYCTLCFSFRRVCVCLFVIYMYSLSECVDLNALTHIDLLKTALTQLHIQHTRQDTVPGTHTHTHE